MTTIRIAEGKDAGSATVTFDSREPFTVAVTDPLSAEGKKLVDWYFEDYVRSPDERPEDNLKAKAEIERAGNSLFNQVFGTSAVEYSLLTPGEFLIEIVGGANFQSLPWEWLWKPRDGFPLCRSVPIVRRNLASFPSYKPKESTELRILMIVARPRLADVNYRAISWPLVQMLRDRQSPAQLEIVRPGTWEALQERLSEKPKGYYHILHFDGHGDVPADGKAFLRFESGTPGKPHDVDSEEFARNISAWDVGIVVLNACESGRAGAKESSLANRIVAYGVPNVVAMSHSCTVTAAALFMEKLYETLIEGKGLDQAVLSARHKIAINKSRAARAGRTIDLEDWAIPVVYHNRPTAIQLNQRSIPDWENGTPREFPDPFEGRDRDVLDIEQRILANRRSNRMFVEGPEGSGVSALLKYLAAWWQATGLRREVFFVEQGDRRRSLTEILDQIAEKILPVEDLKEFRLLKVPSVRRLAYELAQKPHLIVVDSGESHEELKDFANSLVGGKTLVLFGGCRKPEWFSGQAYRLSILPNLPAAVGREFKADVFLAETASDLREGHIAPLKNELEKHQFSVFDRMLGGTEGEIRDEVEKVLKFAKLAIFVVGPRSTRAPEGAESVLQIQYEMATRANIPCFIWLTGAPTDARQTALVEGMRRANFDLWEPGKSLDAVRQRVIEILRGLEKAPAAVPVKTDLGRPQKRQVYFYFDMDEPKLSGDKPPLAALDVRDALLAAKEFRLRTCPLDPKVNREEAHRQALEQAASVVLYWNTVNETWVTSHIEDILKRAGTSLSRNAVFVTGDLDLPKQGFNDAEFRPFKDAKLLIEYLAGNENLAGNE